MACWRLLTRVVCSARARRQAQARAQRKDASGHDGGGQRPQAAAPQQRVRGERGEGWSVRSGVCCWGDGALRGVGNDCVGSTVSGGSICLAGMDLGRSGRGENSASLGHGARRPELDICIYMWPYKKSILNDSTSYRLCRLMTSDNAGCHRHVADCKPSDHARNRRCIVR